MGQHQALGDKVKVWINQSVEANRQTETESVVEDSSVMIEEAGGANSQEESYESVQEQAESWSAYRPSSDSWSYTQEAEAWTLSTPELLPDFLQAWYIYIHTGRLRA